MTSTSPTTADRRRSNNPHISVRAAGAEAARKGCSLHECPYQHPAMRSSWLKGFAQGQQLAFDFS
ncbi:CrpP family protein [Pseudomonas cichorii]|uniref:ribosome modulation factor n=1 Tax=Pseudomonas cichorii TaxID=36746 RepID=UPI0018E602BC|nr:CrpP family ICE-associated protein [Pseudomonas cichorii]MBI6855933.1 CrpP family protein [Pseudomonas cichorii]